MENATMDDIFFGAVLPAQLIESRESASDVAQEEQTSAGAAGSGDAAAGSARCRSVHQDARQGTSGLPLERRRCRCAAAAAGWPPGSRREAVAAAHRTGQPAPHHAGEETGAGAQAVAQQRHAHRRAFS